MSKSRQDALKRLLGLDPVIQIHLVKIASASSPEARSNWIDEVRQLLRQMEGVLRHVGKKTAEEWQKRINSYRDQLD